eukprot:6157349-Amphidinium_carterae.1
MSLCLAYAWLLGRGSRMPQCLQLAQATASLSQNNMTLCIAACIPELCDLIPQVLPFLWGVGNSSPHRALLGTGR